MMAAITYDSTVTDKVRRGVIGAEKEGGDGTRAAGPELDTKTTTTVTEGGVGDDVDIRMAGLGGQHKDEQNTLWFVLTPHLFLI